MLWRPLTSLIGCWVLECAPTALHLQTHAHTQPLTNREKEKTTQKKKEDSLTGF